MSAQPFIGIPAGLIGSGFLFTDARTASCGRLENWADCPKPVPIGEIAESVYAERAIKAGDRGYLSKQQLDDTVLIAIRRVLGGEIFLSEKMTARFAEKFLGGFDLQENSPLAALTDRQLEVFRLIGRGHGTREIAERLNLSIKTIESHRENLKQKLTLKSSAALVQSATRWIDTGEVS